MKRLVLVMVAALLGAAGVAVVHPGDPAASQVAGGLYQPVAPWRAIDTRSSGGTPARTTIQVGVSPPAGAVAVAANITIAGNHTPGHLTVWEGGPRPDTSAVNTLAVGDAIANFVIVPLGSGGTISIWPLMHTGIVVDVMGYVMGGGGGGSQSGQITATVTGYDGQAGAFAFTEVLGTVTNGTSAEVDARIEVPCGNGLTASDLVFGLGAGATVGWSVLCNDVFFTSGATASVVLI